MKKIIYLTIVTMLLVAQTVGSFALTGDTGIKEAKCVHRYGSWTVSRKATCTGTGLETQKCTKCGYKNTRVIRATGHRFGNYRVTKKATCTSQGTETRTCSKCGLKNSRSTKALGHSHTVWYVKKKATCTTSGERYSVCIRCPNKKTERVNALGHRWGNYSTVKYPSCISKGQKARNCKVCGQRETAAIGFKPHELGKSYIKINGKTKGAIGSITAYPTKWYRQCKRCDREVYIKTTCTSGHSFVMYPSLYDRWLKLRQTGKDPGATVKCKICGHGFSTTGGITNDARWEYVLKRYRETNDWYKQ